MTISLDPFPYRTGKDEDKAVLSYMVSASGVAGVPTYHQQKKTTAQFDNAVREILYLNGGDFGPVTEENVNTYANATANSTAKAVEGAEVEGKEDEQDEDGMAGGEKKEEVKTAGAIEEKMKEMTVEEMGGMRGLLQGKILQAWTQIFATCDFLRALTPGQHYPYHDNEPLPTGYYPLPEQSLAITTSTGTVPPPKLIVNALDDRRMMLARYRKGLTDLQEGLKAGAERMMKRREGEKKYWEEVVELAGYPKSSETEEENGDGEKTVPWSIRLRELAHAAYEIPQDRQMASDVFIPIAADEANPSLRQYLSPGAVATIEFSSTSTPANSEDGTTKGEVAGPTRLQILGRSHRRLRVSIRAEGNRIVRSGLNIKPESTNPEKMAGAAQEMFEREIFDKVTTEARADATLNARISVNSLTISPSPNEDLLFEMVDPEEAEEEEEESNAKPSARADLILAIIKLGLLQVYRARNRHIEANKKAAEEMKAFEEAQAAQARSRTRPTGPQPKPPVAQHVPIPTVLGSLIPYLHYQAFLQGLFQILEAFKSAMNGFGLEMRWDRHDHGVTGGLEWAELAGIKNEKREGSVDVTLEDRQIVSIIISSTSQFTLIFPHNTINCNDIAQLPLFIAHEMRKCVLDVLQAHLSDRSPKVDYPDGSLATVKTKIQIKIEARPSLSRARALIRLTEGELDAQGNPSTSSKIEQVAYDPSTHSSLLDWARSVV